MKDHRKPRLAIITTHPVQYNAPWFKLLSARGNLVVRVFYTWSQSERIEKFDPGFNKNIEWDIPLLEGYDYEFIHNTSSEPGSHHFKGIINPTIIQRIDTFSPDAILVFGWSFHSHLKVLKHYKNKRFILFRGDSTLLDKTGMLKRFARRVFLTWVYRHIDVAVYVGKSNYDYFIYHGVKPENLVFGPHAIDNQRFSTRRDRAIYRQQLGISDSALVFLYAGKLAGYKNVGTMISAFKTLNAGDDVHLVIVGNGPLEQELKKNSKFAGIHFLDFQNQSQMPDVYAMGDVFVMSSTKTETWGLAVNEAMANGCAVLVSKTCGCCADLVQDGKNGYSFDAFDESSLVEKMLAFVQHREDIPKMKTSSKEIIAHYNFEANAIAVEHAILNQLVDAK